MNVVHMDLDQMVVSLKSGFGIVDTVLNHLSFSGLITDPTTSEVNDNDQALNL
ncbi:hypothetical protein ACSSTO_02240 [Bacillus atrophaeus]|uniref:hypothetical protein n=1 Tax=Bacillus atrophaeus TaxID=1452 RepID=UPI003EDACE21